jgi:hypothetical protein
VEKHEKSWGSELNASEITGKSRRGQFSQPDIDEIRPRTVKGIEKHDGQAPIHAVERPRTRGNMQADHDFAVVSPDQSRKRPDTCKTYQVPLIVTRDNQSKPDVEHTHFGKIINRRVCSANMTRKKVTVGGVNKGVFKSSLDAEFLRLFE